MTFTKVNTTKKVDRLSVKNKKMLDYKQLRLSDNYLYSSDKEQEEEQEKQDEKPFDPNKIIEWMINREKLLMNNELFKKHFKVQKPIVMYKVLYKTNDKKKVN